MAIGFISLAAVDAQVKEGRLRAVAVVGKARAKALPNVPTISETGFPDIAGDSWVGVLVPAGTSTEIINVLHREIVAILTAPDSRSGLWRWAMSRWRARRMNSVSGSAPSFSFGTTSAHGYDNRSRRSFMLHSVDVAGRVVIR